MVRAACDRTIDLGPWVLQLLQLVIMGCLSKHAGLSLEHCTWGGGVEGGLAPWQAAPHLPKAHDSHAVAGWPRQHQERLQSLLVEDPQPVHQPWVRPHRLHEQRQ